MDVPFWHVREYRGHQEIASVYLRAPQVYGRTPGLDARRSGTPTKWSTLRQYEWWMSTFMSMLRYYNEESNKTRL
jgi:hypothetical protein